MWCVQLDYRKYNRLSNTIGRCQWEVSDAWHCITWVVWCVGVVLTRTAWPAPRRVFQSVRLWDSSPILQISRSSTSEHSGLADITTYHEIQVCNIGDTAIWKPAGIIYLLYIACLSPNITPSMSSICVWKWREKSKLAASCWWAGGGTGQQG